MRVIRDRLQDVLEAIAQIQAEQAKGKDTFLRERLVQVWMVHHLMIIGEAVRAIDPAFREQWLDSLTAKQGPADLVLTGICPGCGAAPKLQYWKDTRGNLNDVELSCECDECGSTISLIPCESTRFADPSSTSARQ